MNIEQILIAAIITSCLITIGIAILLLKSTPKSLPKLYNPPIPKTPTPIDQLNEAHLLIGAAIKQEKNQRNKHILYCLNEELGNIITHLYEVPKYPSDYQRETREDTIKGTQPRPKTNITPNQ